jgi:predicted Co/Zn/Cd cation transporter (cation efflux family)
MSKLGTKLYLEVDYVVEAGRWDISDADRVRRALTDRLAALPWTVWLNVDLSTDPAWSA